MKRKLFIITLILLVPTVYLISNLFKFNDIDVSMLLMEETNMPTELTCDWYDDKNIEWEYQEQAHEEFLYLGSNVSDSKAAQWIAKKDFTVINLTIVNYKSPIIAYLYYHLQNPKNLYKYSYENFINQTEIELQRNWDNELSNEDSMQCGLGDEEYCHGLFYRARYGQYFLYIRYQGPDCEKSFTNIVKAINKKFIEFIQ